MNKETQEYCEKLNKAIQTFTAILVQEADQGKIADLTEKIIPMLVGQRSAEVLSALSALLAWQIVSLEDESESEKKFKEIFAVEKIHVLAGTVGYIAQKIVAAQQEITVLPPPERRH